jgi:hypothetical protein|tara:strand:- start:575 stop:967 length:393 start_codon:yes stop_codon:yes gene_type:complete
MKLNKTILKELIRENILEIESNKKKQRLKSASMSSSAFGKAGKEGRQAVNPELTSLEKGIIQQIDQFLLKLASTPGVDINSQKSVIQRVMKLLQDQIGKMAKPEASPPESSAEPTQQAAADQPPKQQGIR